MTIIIINIIISARGDCVGLPMSLMRTVQLTSSLFAEQLAHLSPARRLSRAGLFSGPTRASKTLVKAKVDIFFSFLKMNLQARL